MMIPFMGAQSLVIGKQFGEGFQYGKRKISAMTNEEFNKLTPAKIAHDSAIELQQMIPAMKDSITDMRSFQTFIVQELIATAKQLPNDIFGEGGVISKGSLASNVIEGKGNEVLEQLFGFLQKSATQQFIGYGPKHDTGIVDTSFNPPPPPPEIKTTGFIGPEKPPDTGTLLTKKLVLLQQELRAASDQLFYSRFDAVKRGSAPLDIMSIFRREHDRRVSKLTFASGESSQSAIDRTSTGLVNTIATKLNAITTMIKSYPALKTNTKRLNQFIELVKSYNRYVQANKKRDMTLDVAKMLNTGKTIKLVLRYK